MARTANRSRTPSNGKSKSQGLPSLPKLSLDAWLDIVGIALVVLAVVTLLSLVSAQRTQLLEGWLGVMRLVFGWGVYAAPLLMGAGGLYLVIRRFGDRIPIPTRLSSHWGAPCLLTAWGLDWSTLLQPCCSAVTCAQWQTRRREAACWAGWWWKGCEA